VNESLTIKLAVGAALAAAAVYAWRARRFVDRASSGTGVAGVLGRAVLGESAASGAISSSRDAASAEVPDGKHTNIRRLRGAILRPQPGTRIDVPLLASGYTVDIVLSNDGDAPVTSPVKLDVQEEGWLGGGELVASGPITLLPGEARVVSLRVPLPGSKPTNLDVDVDLRVYFGGYLVARSRFTRE
jgi:hypothetical protein